MEKPLVLLRAPFATQSGYGTHAKQIGLFLLGLEVDGKIDLYCDALMWGNTTWLVDEHRDPILGQLLRRCKPCPRQPDVSVQLQLPNEWNPKLASRLNVGVTAAVETDRAPKEWVAACESMDVVVFPSKHSEASVVNAGWKPAAGRSVVVPESFPDDLLANGIDASILDPLPKFTFLVFGQMTDGDGKNDRKNLHSTVRWLLEEFADDPEVGVLMKTNMGRSSVFDRYHTEAALSAVKREAAKTVGPSKKLPSLVMLHGDMRDKEVAAVYKHPNVRALVTATRGEGFGLPILEAAACDLPVIATAWSGHLEFLSHGKFVDLPCAVQPIPKGRVDGRIFVEGSKWAEVSELDFKRRLRKFRTSSAIPREWAKELGSVVRERYSQAAVTRIWNFALRDRVLGEEQK